MPIRACPMCLARCGRWGGGSGPGHENASKGVRFRVFHVLKRMGGEGDAVC